jgi:NitT/TauT family transport system substrate-binding protein
LLLKDLQSCPAVLKRRLEFSVQPFFSSTSKLALRLEPDAVLRSTETESAVRKKDEEKMMKYLLMILTIAVLMVQRPALLRAEAIKIGVTGSSIAFTPFYAAKQGGFFKKHGLDVEIVSITGATIVVQALLGGNIDFAIVGQALVRAAAQGADLTMIASYMNRFPYTFLVKPTIKRVEDLKGGKLAVSSFGSADELAQRISLERLGLNPEKDVTFLQVGGQTARLSALKSGSIDGTVFATPLSGVAKKMGFRELFKMSQLAIFYPHEGIVVSRSYIPLHRDTITRFLKAFVETVHAMKTRKDFAISTMAGHLRLDPVKDRDALEEGYQDEVLGHYEKNPRPSPDAIKFILDVMNKDGKTKVKSSDPKDYIDTSFIDELTKTGFIDALYSKP